MSAYTKEEEARRLWWPRRCYPASSSCNISDSSNSSNSSSNNKAAMRSGQRMMPSVLLRVFNVLLLLSCSRVGSITAHGASVAGAKVSKRQPDGAVVSKQHFGRIYL